MAALSIFCPVDGQVAETRTPMFQVLNALRDGWAVHCKACNGEHVLTRDMLTLKSRKALAEQELTLQKREERSRETGIGL